MFIPTNMLLILNPLLSGSKSVSTPVNAIFKDSLHIDKSIARY